MERWTFARGSSVHIRTSPSSRPSAAQPSVGFSVPLRTRYRGRAMTFGATLSDGLAPVREWRCRCGVARCPPLLERQGLSHAERAQKARKGSEGDAKVRVETPSRRCARGSDARGRARASSCRCRSRQLVFWRREASTLHLNRFGGVRGWAPSSLPGTWKRERSWAKRCRAGSTRKPSRDRIRDRPLPRKRGDAVDGRHFGSLKWAALHGALTNVVLASLGVSRLRKRAGFPAKRQGCQRLGGFGGA